MVQLIKRASSLLILIFIICSCTTIQDSKDQKQESNNISHYFNSDTLFEMTLEQESAFEALNLLQLQSKEHFYSTFVGSLHPCSEPDSTFTITRSELNIAIQKLFSDNALNSNTDKLTQLINKAVMAQEKYTIEKCFGNSGTWVLRNVLGRRDIILEW